tara:strand:- start:2567 stop:2797 length:231 start_codon:yes stop_codon:yes gene_type:complete
MKTELVALRNSKTNEILNLSYSEAGLRFTFSQAGRNLYDQSFTKVVPYKFVSHKNVKFRKGEKNWAWKARILNRPV